MVWNKLPLNGEMPDLVIDMSKYLPPNPETGEPERITIQSATIDDNYMYAIVFGAVFPWKRPLREDRPPDYRIMIGDEASGIIFSDESISQYNKAHPEKDSDLRPQRTFQNS